jgi:hypothetical protein
LQRPNPKKNMEILPDPNVYQPLVDTREVGTFLCVAFHDQRNL